MHRMLIVIFASIVIFSAPAAAQIDGRLTYRVRESDSVLRIALRHGVTPDTLLAANGLASESGITPGTRLTLPDGGPLKVTAPALQSVPEGYDAYVTEAVMLRVGPGGEYEERVELPANMGAAIEGRIAPKPNGQEWMLVRGADPSVYGWTRLDLLIRRPGLNTNTLPTVPLDRQVITVDTTPLELNLRRIFVRGQTLGNNPHLFIKIGDCITEDPRYLVPIAEGEFEFGDSEHLLAVAQYYAGSFDRPSRAAVSGYNAVSLLDPTLADPGACQPGDTPLSCEYRLSKPSIAFIMLGTNDLLMNTPGVFQANMREIVEFLINNGVIPILSTIPGYEQTPYKTLTVEDANAIIRRIAAEYHIPLSDLSLALDRLPNSGIDITADGRHIGDPGFRVRNLLTLQTLDLVWRSITER